MLYLYLILVLIGIVFSNYFLMLLILFVFFLISYLLKGKPILYIYSVLIFFVVIISFNLKYYLFQSKTTLCNQFCSGTVYDYSGSGKYIVKIGEGKYFLNSKNTLNISDKIQIRPYKIIYTSPIKFSFLKVSLNYTFDFDYNNRLYMKGFHGVIYPSKIIVQGKGNIPFYLNLKNHLIQKITNVYGESKHAGLLAGMLIGDKSRIPDADYENFIDSGLVHLVAVSGGNIVILVMFLGYILFFLPFYVRNVVISLILIVYTFLCGLDSSIVRAAIMGILSYIAIFFGREFSIYRLISYSLFIMLIINPFYLLLDFGFQLSYFAILGLIGIGKIVQFLPNNYPGKEFLSNYLFPTIGANFGVLPLLILFAGKINLLGIIGNILVLPVVSFIMIYGICYVFVDDLVDFTYGEILLTNLLDYVYNISSLVVRFGFYFNLNGYLSITLFLFIYLLVIISLLYITKKYNKID